MGGLSCPNSTTSAAAAGATPWPPCPPQCSQSTSPRLTSADDRGDHRRRHEREHEHRQHERQHPHPRPAPRPRGAAGGPRGRSTSRAAASPPRGTRTSRGPAARKSGTSKPPERRTSDGIAGLEQQPLQQLGLGLVLRRRDPHRLALGVGRMDLARAGRGLVVARRRRGRRAPARSTNGEPQRGQNRSLMPPPVPHAGHTSGAATSVLLDLERAPRRPCRRDVPGAHVVALGVLDADDQVDRVGKERRG